MPAREFVRRPWFSNQNPDDGPATDAAESPLRKVSGI